MTTAPKDNDVMRLQRALAPLYPEPTERLDETVPEVPVKSDTLTIAAKYDQTCPAGCGQRILEGQPIRRLEHTGWVHVACHRRALNPPEVCGVCWMTKPCDCDPAEFKAPFPAWDPQS